MKIIEVNPNIKILVDHNEGYCPCAIHKTEETKCMCKEFREQKTTGYCHCERFLKVEE